MVYSDYNNKTGKKTKSGEPILQKFQVPSNQDAQWLVVIETILSSLPCCCVELEEMSETSSTLRQRL